MPARTRKARAAKPAPAKVGELVEFMVFFVITTSTDSRPDRVR